MLLPGEAILVAMEISNQISQESITVSKEIFESLEKTLLRYSYSRFIIINLGVCSAHELRDHFILILLIDVCIAIQWQGRMLQI